MASFAKITLLGNLGKDPVLTKGAETAKSYTDFSVATEKYAGKNENGTPKYVTEWWSTRLFGKTAEYIAQHAKKGTTVYVEGEPDIRVVGDKTYFNVKGNLCHITSRAVKSAEDNAPTENEPTIQSAAPASRGARAAAAAVPAAAAPVAAKTQAAVAVADVPEDEDEDDTLPF